jgi:phage shock protein PspC (stress-responsive transcriptional regulator)
MDKSVKINLSGTLFQIDEEAYHVLRDYLQALNNRFKNVTGGNETIEDIESRIAEIFQSMGGTAGVITKENVEAMIGIIGQPGDFETNEPSVGVPPGTSYRRRLYRNPDERIISGICGGIGSYLNIDPVWIRLIFILFAFTFGIGFLLYLALWIAVPFANSDSRKRELHGEFYHSKTGGNVADNEFRDSNTATSINNNTTRNIGNAFNEVFMALGRFFFIIFRVFTIIFGVILVILGFTSMLAFLLVLFIKNHGFLPAEIHGNFFYLPDFLNFVINPVLTPWIIILVSLVVLLPLLAIIYWGIKMIFWFRSRDGVISLIALVIWVMSLTGLVILLSGQGLNFSETGRVYSSIVLDNPPDTLYIITDRKIDNLNFNRELNIAEGSYSLFANTESNELSIRANLNVELSDKRSARIEVLKRSSAAGRLEATRRAESLPYNYRLSKDTLYLDEYFTLPKDQKWSGDEVNMKIYVPDGTVVSFDKQSQYLMCDYDRDEEESQLWQPGDNFWVITSEGLKKISPLKSSK